MSTIIIDSIPLEPYSYDRLIVVSGHNADEVIAWFKENYGSIDTRDLKKIKKHHEWVREMVAEINDLRKDLEELDQYGVSSSNGMYTWQDLKSYPNSKFRMIILKYGFDPTNPHNMGTLAHETLHLCQEFLPIFLDRNKEMEAEAYFHSHIMEKIYSLFL
jgi:hypothetical protein